MFVLWKVIASLIVVVALTIGFIDILINVESNGCEMTYMYENPQYHVSKNVIALLFFFHTFGLSFSKCLLFKVLKKRGHTDIAV